MSDYIQVITTVEQKEDAEKIATALVENRFAACVQVLGPLTSYYQWQGKLETAQEYLCLVKSRKDLFSKLETVVRDIHPYDVPEILATPITDVSRDYLTWLEKELESETPEWGKDI